MAFQNYSDNEKVPIGLELLTFLNIDAASFSRLNDGTRTWVTKTHLASTEEDFIQVRKRDLEQTLKKEGIKIPNEIYLRKFDEILIGKVQNYIDRYEKYFRDFHDRQSIRVLAAAESFLKWLIESKGKNEDLKFDAILKRIKFDTNQKTKNEVEDYLKKLNDRELFRNAKDNEFTAIALVFYQTGWVINTPTFSEWLEIFSDVFGRKKPNYKPNHVKIQVEEVKRKLPFLDKLPKK